MTTVDRRKYILDELQKYKKVSIKEISENLKVSSMTIRRDLSSLFEQGIITLSQGMAFLVSGALFENSMTLKQTEMVYEKKMIAQYCSTLIKEGDSIFLDTGSTNQFLAEYISNKKNLVIITHSLLAANSLIHSKNIKLIMAPGIFREKTMGFLGQLTIDFIQKFKIDKLFLASEGLDFKFGATVPDILDGETKEALVKHAEKTILAIDSSKIGKSFFMSIANSKVIDEIITDYKAKPEVITELKNLGYCVTVVTPEIINEIKSR